MHRSRYAVTADAAADVGLPPIAMHVDVDGLPLFGQALPDGQVYLQFSGPPGGPLFVVVRPAAEGAGLLESFEAAIAETCGAGDATLTLGIPGEVVADGAHRVAVPFACGQDHPLRASVGVAVRYDTAHGAAMLVMGAGGRGDRTLDCATVLKHEVLAAALERFRVGEAPNGWAPPGEPPPTSRQAFVPAADAEPEPVTEEETAADTDDLGPGLNADEVLALLADAREAMRRSGLWQDATPDAAGYARMTPAQQMAWSLQSTLPSCEMQIRAMAGTGAEDGAARGVAQMLTAFPAVFAEFPEAAELVAVLERAGVAVEG